jgi:hypothetical protein
MIADLEGLAFEASQPYEERVLALRQHHEAGKTSGLKLQKYMEAYRQGHVTAQLSGERPHVGHGDSYSDMGLVSGLLGYYKYLPESERTATLDDDLEQLSTTRRNEYFWMTEDEVKAWLPYFTIEVDGQECVQLIRALYFDQPDTWGIVYQAGLDQKLWTVASFRWPEGYEATAPTLASQIFGYQLRVLNKNITHEAKRLDPTRRFRAWDSQ